MAGEARTPIDQFKAAMAVSEVAFGEKTSRQDVILGLANRMAPNLFNSDSVAQKTFSDQIIREVTKDKCKNAAELVAVPIDNQEGYEYARRGIAEALILPVVTFKMNVDSFPDQDTKDGINSAYDVIISGDVNQISAMLPEGMKEMARDVAEVMVPTPIVDRVTTLNKRLLNTENTKSRDAQTINKSIDEIVVEMENMPRGSRDQVVTALIVDKFQKRANELGGEVINNNSKVNNSEREKAELEFYERNRRINQSTEDNTLADWLSTIENKSGKVGLPQTIWATEKASWFQGDNAEWHGFLDRVTTWSNNVEIRGEVMSSAKKNFGGAILDKSFPKLQEKNLAAALEDPHAKLESVLRKIVKDIYVEAIPSKDGSMRALTKNEFLHGKKGMFVFKQGVVGVNDSDNLLQFTDKKKGRSAYLNIVANELINDGYADDTVQSKLMASLGMDFLQFGCGFMGPDHKRKLTIENEDGRTASSPWAKFTGKTEGGEVFGGKWAVYYKKMFDKELAQEIQSAKNALGSLWKNEDEVKITGQFLVKKAQEQEILPVMLCGSILDSEVAAIDRWGNEIKTTMGRALQADQKLVYSKNSTEDVFYSTNKWLDAAATVWQCIAGDITLDIKGGHQELDNVVYNFGSKLNGAYSDLRGKGVEMDIDLVIAAIGGAAGLIPSKPVLLDFPFDLKKKYTEIGSRLMNSMPALTSEERKRVVDYYSLDKKRSNIMLSVYDQLLSRSAGIYTAEFKRALYEGKDGPTIIGMTLLP